MSNEGLFPLGKLQVYLGLPLKTLRVLYMVFHLKVFQSEGWVEGMIFVQTLQNLSKRSPWNFDDVLDILAITNFTQIFLPKNFLSQRHDLIV